MNIWIDFLIVWGILAGVVCFFLGSCSWLLGKRCERLTEELDSIKAAVGSQDLQSVKELDVRLLQLENEKLLLNDQNGELWKENIRLRKMQEVMADKGKMARLEEWIEETDERNRQVMAALAYQSMTPNKLENPLGIKTPDYFGIKTPDYFPPELLPEISDGELEDMNEREGVK